MWYDERFQQMDIGDNFKALLKFILLSIREDISYTSKDGQFLRWDSRSGKVRQRNAKRIANEKMPYKPFHKRTILPVQRAILQALDHIILDVSFPASSGGVNGKQELIVGSVLDAPAARAGLGRCRDYIAALLQSERLYQNLCLGVGFPRCRPTSHAQPQTNSVELYRGEQI